MKNYNKHPDSNGILRGNQQARQEFVVQAAIEIMAERINKTHINELMSNAKSMAGDAWVLALTLLEQMPDRVRDGSL